MSLNNSISKGDENFLKEFLKGFYRQIIKREYYDNFESILTECIKYVLENNKKSSKIILKLMKHHEKTRNWFSSLIEFFYEHGMGDDNIIDKNKSLELYLISINKNENKELISSYQLLNIIIGKYY